MVFSISGAISGLDTASMVEQLIAVESNQQTLLQNRQIAEQATIDAYAALITKLKSLSTTAASVANTSAWKGVTASSSSSSVAATATGTTPGSVTFDVTSVARAHTLISDGTITGTDAVIASGPLTLTHNGTTETLDVGNGSLASVVSAINNGDLGLRATAIQVSPGAYKLQVTSTSTGSASAFTLDGLDGLSGVSTLTTGTDAQITIGAGTASEFTVTSSSNTFSDIVPGLSFTVSKVESDVTVSSSLDGSAVADEIQALVDAANEVLSTIKTQTAWNADTQSASALNGESAVRDAQQRILALVGANTAAGVSLTRDGTITFDEDAFTAAFTANPTLVAQQFGAKTTFSPASGVTGSISLVRAGTDARAGDYTVEITQAAAKEQWSTTPAGGTFGGETIVLTQGSKTFSYTTTAGQTLADAVTELNTQLSAAGLSVTASEDGSALAFTATNAGTSSAFSVTVDGTAATQVTAGRDVQGTINGAAATGSGSVLSGSGLSLRVDMSDADVAASGGSVGTVNYASGLAQGFVDLVSDLTSSTTGTLTSAQTSLENVVKDLQDKIDAWDYRLELRRAALTRQFTAMETALAALESSSSFLSSFSTSSDDS